mmetsp:Transcript_6458/g.12374  ORF Transcript_6458/g.12374 Transcript_6458/m.12374 type:complete len:208 (-) Transcript_6458:1399-2022(-)
MCCFGSAGELLAAVQAGPPTAALFFLHGGNGGSDCSEGAAPDVEASVESVLASAPVPGVTVDDEPLFVSASSPELLPSSTPPSGPSSTSLPPSPASPTSPPSPMSAPSLGSTWALCSGGTHWVKISERGALLSQHTFALVSSSRRRLRPMAVSISLMFSLGMKGSSMLGPTTLPMGVSRTLSFKERAGGARCPHRIDTASTDQSISK